MKYELNGPPTRGIAAKCTSLMLGNAPLKGAGCCPDIIRVIDASQNVKKSSHRFSRGTFRASRRAFKALLSMTKAAERKMNHLVNLRGPRLRDPDSE
jgi:hypothetical protein